MPRFDIFPLPNIELWLEWSLSGAPPLLLEE
jgi:hypothetical protein